VAERRLGALLAAAREARPQRLEPRTEPRRALAPRTRPDLEDELFEDAPLSLTAGRGALR